MAINLPASAFTKFNEAVLLFMRTATLVYPPIQEDWPNCIKQTLGGRSVNIYTPGGPVPFTTGMPCPYCNGQGVRLSEVTEDISLRIYWDKRSWISIGVDIDVPDGAVQTIGYMSDYEKMKKANKLIAYFPDSEEKASFTRMGEGFPMGFKQNPTQYITLFWRRI